MDFCIDRRIQIAIAVLALVLLGCTWVVPSLTKETLAPTATQASIATPVLTATLPPTVPARVALSQEQIVIDIYKRVSPSVISRSWMAKRRTAAALGLCTIARDTL